MIKLSIIVTVYKVEKYLCRCIDSIMMQTYRNFELILVDDGSPDNCPFICDEYARNDIRVKVIHQENMGAVQARWNGLLVASGEYVAYVDGDDWMEPDMYEHMLELAMTNSADMVVTGYIQETEKKYEYKSNMLESGIYTGEKIEQIYDKALYIGKFYEPGIIPAFWNKLIKRDLLIDNIQKPNNIIRMGEDAALIYPLIARSSCIVIDNEFKPYHYRIVSESMSHRFDELYFERALELLRGMKSNLNNNKIMQNELIYYALFIVQIGFSQLFSRNCTMSYEKRINIIKKFFDSFRKIDICSDIDWNGFDQNSVKDLKYFVEGKIYKCVLHIYMKKILKRAGIYR